MRDKKNNPNGLSHRHFVGMDVDKLLNPIMANLSLFQCNIELGIGGNF
jgi:hypothetical protein